jgi:hypothetical protein
MPSDVGLVAQLLTVLAKWAFVPEGYAKMSREDKLEELENGVDAALKAKAYDALDLIWVEYRRVRAEQG